MKRFILLVVCSVFLATSAWAIPVKFQWNASTGAVAGYKLHQGTVSGTYTSSQDVPGTGTTGTMEMDPVASRYVAATAYDAAKRESAFSNEILCHPVVVTSNTGGLVSPNGSFFVQQGRSVTLMVTPSTGNRILTVKVDGNPIEAPYTITNVSKRTTVDVQFDLLPPGAPSMLDLVQQISATLDRIDEKLATLIDLK